jgi:hypothetical protein
VVLLQGLGRFYRYHLEEIKRAQRGEISMRHAHLGEEIEGIITRQTISANADV